MSIGMVDREHERAAIDQLLTDAWSGLSGAIVMHGEAGIGKTALLDVASANASDLQVIRAIGIVAEADYAFGALHRMLVPYLGELDRLTTSQRDALEVAFGISDGIPATPFRVAVAVLSLLAEIATGRPLLLCVDDAQWLDPESRAVLAFVARRVHAEGIALLFAVREDGEVPADFDGIAMLPVRGLDTDSALELLDRVLDETVDPQVAVRVVAATAGNPLALTDLGASWSVAEAARAVPVEPLPIGPELAAHYLAVVRSLPAPAQQWLTVAAAEPTGDVTAVADAAARLEIAVTAADAAEAIGIVTVRTTITFRHPLVRAAIYNGATRADRRAAHAALAEVIAEPADEERRIWHLAAATTGPDAAVAELLARSAGRARDRGGFAASADLLARAAALTPDRRSRNRRSLAAASAALEGGAPRRARELLQSIDHTVINPVGAGFALLLETDIDVQTGVPGAFARASARDLEAARLMTEDPRLAEEALVRAFHHGINAEGLIEGTTTQEIAEHVREVASSTWDPTTAAVLRAFAALAVDGYVTAVPTVRAAITALLDPELVDERNFFRDVLGVTLTMTTWDLESQWELLERMHLRARAVGALRDLDTVLYCQTMAATDRGDLAAASRYFSDGQLTRSALGATDTQWDIYRHPEYLAWRGDLDGLPDVLTAVEQASVDLGNGAVVGIARIARVIDAVARGNYADAAEVARGLVDGDTIGVHSRVLPNLVEAAERSGDRELATRAFAALDERARASGTSLALGLRARSAALLAEPDDAADLYEVAIDHLTAAGSSLERARAHLLYGEWLRRDRRRSEAREQLRIAHEQFADLGAASFAERARVELEATGERARKRTVDTSSDLTPQELQVARHAAEGDTNAEIAEKLFISARTVDYHLRKVFRKLGIGSRRELRGRFD